MHELSIARALLAQVERAARAHGGGPVRRIRLRVGPLSGVEPPLLARAFTRARPGTLAAVADLDIETTPVCVHCPACGAETAAAVNRLACAACGNRRVTLVSGDELMLLGLDLDPAGGTTPRENAHV